MTEEIRDFTDYAKPIDFKFQNDIFRIPSFDKCTIEKLMDINSEMISKKDDLEKDDDDKDSTNKDVISNKEYFKVQDKMLVAALLKKDNDGNFKPIDNNIIVNWPIKLKNKIMTEVNEQMKATVDEGDDSTEAKKS